ncbi:MAG: hypothetical protein FD143_3601 [Ignavibacteria bacterium]|nr:MAG: hypothetical protein FD143_3601 [Ignavibacteria bacterium]
MWKIACRMHDGRIDDSTCLSGEITLHLQNSSLYQMLCRRIKEKVDNNLDIEHIRVAIKELNQSEWFADKLLILCIDDIYKWSKDNTLMVLLHSLYFYRRFNPNGDPCKVNKPLWDILFYKQVKP